MLERWCSAAIVRAAARVAVLGSPLLAVMIATGVAAFEVEGAQSVDVRLGLVAQTIAGQRASHCTLSAELQVGVAGTLRGSFGEALPDPDGKWKATASAARCGKDAGAVMGSRSTGGTGKPYLLVEASVTPLRSVGSAVDLMALFSMRKLSGFSETGQPIYGETTERRTLTVEDGVDALIPMLVADHLEEENFGIHEVMVQVGARDRTPAGPAYGAIFVRTDTAGAEILLDGGPVGRTSQEKSIVLRNVLAGEREVCVRDESGRGARRMVRVPRGRTVLVALSVANRALVVPARELVPIGRNDRGYEEYRRKRDGAVMVKVPEGEFLMGNLETEGRPFPHRVYVSTFLMDKTPVTWGQYKRFLEDSGTPLPPDDAYWGLHDDHPAVFVTWEESRAYCEWVGGRLPTEAEREKGARGTDQRKYPWGDREPDPQLAVFRHNWGLVATEPVGIRRAGASPYGLLEMAGNVWEWCEDWYDPRYYEVSPTKDPRGPATGRSHVVRGGSWDSRPTVLSCSCRGFGYVGYREGDFGFRCAADSF